MNHLDSLTPTIVLVTSTLINHVCKEGKALTMRDVLVVLSPSVPTLVPILVAMLKSAILAATAAGDKKEAGKEGDAAANAARSGVGGGVGVWFAQCWHAAMMWLAWLLPGWLQTGEEEECSDDRDRRRLDAWVLQPALYQTQHVKCTLEFIHQLSIYLNSQKDKTCFYDVVQHEQQYEINNATNLELTQTWSDICIHIPVQAAAAAAEGEGGDAAALATTAKIQLSKLSVNLAIHPPDAVPKIAKASALFEKKREIDLTKITRLSDFINDDAERESFQAKVTRERFEGLLGSLSSYVPRSADASSSYVEYSFALRLKEVCPNLEIDMCGLEYMIILSFCAISENNTAGYTFSKMIDLVDLWVYLKNTVYLFGNWVKLKNSAHGKLHAMCKPIYDDAESIYSEYRFIDALSKYLKSDICKTNEPPAASATAPDSFNRLAFTLPSLAVCPQINIAFQKFLLSIQHNTAQHQSLCDSASTTTKIKIYNLAIERKEERVETPNPEYTAYEERRVQITQLEKSEQTAALMADFLRMNPYPPSPKHFVETKWKPEISVQLVNEKSKRFDTLYLRELDMRKLRNILTKFKNSTELFDTYGLPNKLGILLHGEPGTGKTSAIHAIATFLQKNIYYTNLSNVETNAELQMLFDHVQLCSSGGGIIVFEDIDAMTTVVHRRQPAVAVAPASSVSAESLFASGTSTPETQISKWSGAGAGCGNSNAATARLTLEYLLNLLQGSLTRDGTLFIATTNHKEKLDPALYRVGRFDVDIEMKKCDHYQIQTIYNTFVKRVLPPALLRRVPEDKFTPAQFIFQCVQFIQMDDVSDEVILEPFLMSNNEE